MFTSKHFWWSNPPLFLRFAAAIVSVGSALFLAQVLERHWQSTPYVSLFLCAIIFSAWFGGFRAGLLAVLLSILAFDYFFLAPTHSLVVNTNEVPRLVLFVASALLVGLLSAAQRSTATFLRQARDSLAVKVRELEKNNETLRRTETYLAEAQRLSHTGSFGWKVASGEIQWSEETFRIFQYDPKTKPTVDLILQRVHPDDTSLVKEAIGRASRDGKDFDFEHRLLMPDASVKHVRIVAHAERDGTDRLEFIGAVMDVTVIKEVEDKIRLIINTVPGLLWTARPDGWVDFLNQRWLDYTGMTLDQGLGWAWQPGYHPDDLENVLRKWRAAVAEKKPLDVEARLRRFDGEYRWFLKRAFPLFDNAGHVLGWYGGNIDIHDLKQAEEQLRESEAYLSEGQRMSHTGSWAWSVKTKENLFWSKEHYRIYGFDPDADSGQYGAARQRIHPVDLRAFDEKLDRAIQEKRDFEIDYRIVLPGGEVKHIHNLGHPRFNQAGELVEFIGTTMDVTERKLSEALLSSEMHTLEIIAAGAPLTAVLDILCRTIDEQSPGSISSVLSLDPDGQRLWPVAGPNVPENWTRSISPLVIGPKVGSCGTAAYRKETVVVSDIATDPLWADFCEAALSFGLRACWSKPILSNNGTVLGTFAMYYDSARQPEARELKLIERATHIALIAFERDRVQDSLRKAQANLAHVTRVTTMGELTASIAHEVNQPLTAVINNANACLGLLPDNATDLHEVREALTEIVDDADRASAVIARIRQLAKKTPNEKTPLDLKIVVADVLALAQYESTMRQIVIRTELAEELPRILGDRVQLQQVLLNLIVNGMDAMSTVEQSKRILTISARREVRDGMPGALVSVQDAGVGFKAEETLQLFEAFYTTKPHGMGMGLAISRSIIEAHSGRLWAERNAELGATFLFSLPGVGNSPG